MLASAFSGVDRRLFAIDTFDRQRGWSNGGTDDWIFTEWSQRQFAQKVIDDCGLSKSIVLKQGRSEEFVEELSALQDVGLIFIDADHSYSGCKQDLLGYSPILSEEGLLLVDDYASEEHKGVKQAVDEFLKSHTEYVALFLIDVMLVIRKNPSSSS